MSHSHASECDLPLCLQRLYGRASLILQRANNLSTVLNDPSIDASLIAAELLPVVGNLSLNTAEWSFVTGNGEIYQLGNSLMIPLSIRRVAGTPLTANIATVPVNLAPLTTIGEPMRVQDPAGPTNIGPLLVNIAPGTGAITLATVPGALPVNSELSYMISYPAP